MHSLRSRGILGTLSVLIGACVLSLPARYAQAAPASESDADSQPDAPETLPWKLGPASLALGHGVALQLPAEYQFLAQPQAGQLMVKLGNLYNDNLLGVVVPNREDVDYFITVRYDEEGYIKDDETLDGDAILKAIRDGEEEYNAERKKRGFPAIHADGWQEKPHYDSVKHQVIWGLALRTLEADKQGNQANPDNQGGSVNYNTRVLGRKGYVSVNLVTDVTNLPAHKPAAGAILAGTGFVNGLRYEDFDAKSDKVAEYGLTGLVLGGVGLGVAKLVKIGLLAKFGKVLLAALIAGKKLIGGLLVAGVAAARRLLGSRRRTNEPQA